MSRSADSVVGCAARAASAARLDMAGVNAVVIGLYRDAA
jgi:hypothetical protein